MTNALYITLRNVTKYYFVDKQRKMTSNGWKQLTNISLGTLGRNYGLRCLLMPLHVSSIHATDLLVSRFDNSILECTDISERVLVNSSVLRG